FAFTAIEEISRPEGQGSRHQQAGFRKAIFAVWIACTPRAAEGWFSFFIYLPAYFTESVDTVGCLVHSLPVQCALGQYAVHVLFFLHDGGFKLADTRNIERFLIAQNDGFLAVIAVRMVGPLEDEFLARLERKIERVVSMRFYVFGLQEPIFQRRVIALRGEP